MPHLIRALYGSDARDQDQTSDTVNLKLAVSWRFYSSGLCCRYLVKFLAKLAQDSDVNKMSPSNIAIVLGPNLLWAKAEG